MVCKLRFPIAVALLLSLGSAAMALCGDQGGSGFRGPDGKCVSHAQAARVCGTPRETRCVRERLVDVAPEREQSPEAKRRTIGVGQPSVSAAMTGARFCGAVAVIASPAAAQTEQKIDPQRIRVLDGDTIQLDRKRPNIRLVGFNAPETDGAACNAERALGFHAKARLIELLDSGPVTIRFVACACKQGTEGTMACNYGRQCARLAVRGKDIGEKLIEEKLAVPFVCGATTCPPTPKPWCADK